MSVRKPYTIRVYPDERDKIKEIVLEHKNKMGFERDGDSLYDVVISFEKNILIPKIISPEKMDELSKL